MFKEPKELIFNILSLDFGAKKPYKFTRHRGDNTMPILMIPVFAFFYWISSFDSLSKRIFGLLFWADVILVLYSVIPLLDGERLLMSFLLAVPISAIAFYGVIKLLDFIIKICDYILKKTS